MWHLRRPIWNRTRPRVLVQNQHTRELISAWKMSHRHHNKDIRTLWFSEVLGPISKKKEKKEREWNYTHKSEVCLRCFPVNSLTAENPRGIWPSIILQFLQQPCEEAFYKSFPPPKLSSILSLVAFKGASLPKSSFVQEVEEFKIKLKIRWCFFCFVL